MQKISILWFISLTLTGRLFALGDVDILPANNETESIDDDYDQTSGTQHVDYIFELADYVGKLVLQLEEKNVKIMVSLWQNLPNLGFTKVLNCVYDNVDAAYSPLAFSTEDIPSSLTTGNGENRLRAVNV